MRLFNKFIGNIFVKSNIRNLITLPNLYIYIYIYVCVCVCVCVHTYDCISVCIYVCVYVF